MTPNNSPFSQTFVVCGNQEVVGFYALETGSVSRQEAPGGVRRKMPDPIPVIVLGRLAVDLKWQDYGIGSGLLKDAVIHVFSVSREVGVRALLVHKFLGSLCCELNYVASF
jgi:predicted N-acetyltransferase YhbS